MPRGKLGLSALALAHKRDEQAYAAARFREVLTELRVVIQACESPFSEVS